MTTKSTSTPFFTAVRDELRSVRAQRAARKQLERQLESYRTPADLDDLAAILDRYDDADAAPVRRILDRRRADLAA